MDGTDKVIVALGFFTVIGLIVYFVYLSNGGSLFPAQAQSPIFELRKRQNE